MIEITTIWAAKYMPLILVIGLIYFLIKKEDNVC